MRRSERASVMTAATVLARLSPAARQSLRESSNAAERVLRLPAGAIPAHPLTRLRDVALISGVLCSERQRDAILEPAVFAVANRQLFDDLPQRLDRAAGVDPIGNMAFRWAVLPMLTEIEEADTFCDAG